MGSYYCTAGTTYITAYCGDVCYATVVALGKIPQTQGSLTNGFVVSQTCIAKDSCLKKMNCRTSNGSTLLSLILFCRLWKVVVAGNR